VTDMDTYQYAQVLRLHLLDMARVSQRGVDYAIKAYKFGVFEFCKSVRDDTYEIDVLHREITEIARDLLMMKLRGEPDLRCVLASEQIANALRAMHRHAVEIAANSMRILENGGGLGCTELPTMGDLVNSLVRLSVVALFQEELEHAELVLRCNGIGRLLESTFYDWYRTIDPSERAQAGFEREITRHLSQVARQTHEIAGGVVFSLQDLGDRSGDEADEQALTSDETTSEVDLRKAVPIPNGMDSFLQSIDACFADTRFWSRL